MPRPLLVPLLAVAACGGATTPITPDQPDGRTVVGTPVTVTVHVDRPDDPSTPAMGVTVYFNNADLSLAATTTTDAAGNATAVVGDGGSVTAKWTSAYQVPFLATVMGVHDHDHVDLTALIANRHAKLGTMTMTVPAIPNAEWTTIYDGCEAATNSGNLAITTCAKQPLDLVAIIRDGGEQIIGASEVKGVSFQDGGTVTFPTPTAPPSFTAHFDGLDAHASGLAFERRGGFRSKAKASSVAPGSTDLTLALPPNGYGAAYGITTVDHTGGSAVVIEAIDPQATSYTLDLTGALPDGALGVTWDNEVGVGFTAFTLAPTGSLTGDFLYAHFFGGVPPGVTGDWYVVAPPDVRSLGLPIVPGAAVFGYGSGPDTLMLVDADGAGWASHQPTLMRDVGAILSGAKGRVRGLI